MSAIERQLLEHVKKSDGVLDTVLGTVKSKEKFNVKELEKLKPDALAKCIISLYNVTVTSNKLMTSSIDKIGSLKEKTMEKYENQLEKMDNAISKLSDVVSNAHEAVTKVEGNVEVMNEAAMTLAIQENNVTSSLKSYADVTQAFIAKNAQAETPKAGNQMSRQSMDESKKMYKQAWVEASSEEARKRSVIIHGLKGGLRKAELKSIVNDLLCAYGRLDCSFNEENFENIFYIGKVPESSETVRPVKVTFNQRHAAAEVLENSYKLKDLNEDDFPECTFDTKHNFKEIYINPDRSYSDRQKIKKLVIDLKEMRKEQPNVSWRINYKTLKVVQYEHVS